MEPFYDLPTVLPTLRGQTVTNGDLVLDIQYTLMETPSANVWAGTDQFNLTQVSTAIQRRRDQFLRETGAVVTRSQTAYAAPADGRIALDEAVLEVRRAAWRPDASQILLPLIRSDEWGSNHYSPSWLTATTMPRYYSVSVVPPLTLQIMAPPSGNGTLDMVSVNKGATIDPAVSASLGVPDDWTWVIKFGALADLLNGDGLALDTQRMQYCEQRWDQGIAAAKRASVVLAGRINGNPCVLGSLSDADAYSPTWQLLGGVPRTLLLSGQTLLGTWPPPGAIGGQWTLLLDVVRNAPVPTAGADILQIGQDVYDSILDYAQHLATMKEGDSQTEASLGLLERFARAAGAEINIQQAEQPARSPLLYQTRTDESSLPRELPAVEIA